MASSLYSTTEFTSIGGSDSNEGTTFSKVDATNWLRSHEERDCVQTDITYTRRKEVSLYIYTERTEIIVITVIKIHGLFVLRSEERRAPRSRWRDSLQFICPRDEEVLMCTVDVKISYVSLISTLVWTFLSNNLSRDSYMRARFQFLKHSECRILR